MGDLLTTCFGDSRNRYFGNLIGAGMPVKKALGKLEEEKKRSEGYLTIPGFKKLAQEKGLTLPVLEFIYDVVYLDMKPQVALKTLWKATAHKL